MIKSIKLFFGDYCKALKAGTDFYKKHWLGTIIFVIVSYGGLFGGLWLKCKYDERKIIESINNTTEDDE